MNYYDKVCDMFRTAKANHKHFVDITGVGNWLCPQYLSPELKNTLNGLTEGAINSFNYCPYCGERLENNTIRVDTTEYPYYVCHFDSYYAEETIPNEWYSYGYNSWEKAYEEYQALMACGFPEGAVYIRDTSSGMCFSNDEWY